ncbi:MAG: MBL fold metallo-hydrolase [Burkholderiaceae bacterium]|nr:MBL fold metallo-hydrolase [Burkholderiaceae bacterium]
MRKIAFAASLACWPPRARPGPGPGRSQAHHHHRRCLASRRHCDATGAMPFLEYDGKRSCSIRVTVPPSSEHNVKELGIDLTRIDAVVISHRHGDHTSGLVPLLNVNPGVKIYAPQEGAFFKGPGARGFLATENRCRRNCAISTARLQRT